MSSTQPSQPSFSSSELRSLLQITNPDTSAFTCVGHAPSQKRRCRNPIAYSNQGVAEWIVRRLPQHLQDHEQLWSQLLELAGLALCRRYHQNQAYTIAQAWYNVILREVDWRARQPPVIHDITHTRPTPTPTPTTATTRTAAVSIIAPQQHHQQPITLEQLHQQIIALQQLFQQGVASQQPQQQPLAPQQPPQQHIAPQQPHQQRIGPQQLHQQAIAPQQSQTQPVAPQQPHQQPHQQPIAPQHPHQQRIDSAVESHNTPTRVTTTAAERITAPQVPNQQRTAPAAETRNVPYHPTTESHHGHDHNENTTSESTTTTQENEDPCAICHEPFENPCSTPCGHRFCRECITHWLRDNNTCPYDRLPLQVTDLISDETATAEDTECSICLQAFTAPCRTPCGHVFCRGCISDWLRSQGARGARGSCPLDRRALREGDLVFVAGS